MKYPVSEDDVLITRALFERSPRPQNLEAEIQVLRALGRQLTQPPLVILKHLVEIALDLCQAGTAGVSLIETTQDGGEVFRWVALAGGYEGYEGGTAERDFSPCGVCLRRGKPQLFFDPGRYFPDFQQVKPAVVETLVVPLMLEERALGTIWIVSHEISRQFDEEDLRVMTSVADFTAAALYSAQARQSAVELSHREQAARAQAEAASRIKDEFLAILSHELRSPLTPILVGAQLLRSQKFDAKTDRLLEMIEHSAKLQTQLIQDLLDVSSIIQGKLSLNVKPVNLVSVIENALSMIRLEAQAKAIQIQTFLDSARFQIQGDSNRLQQVVLNLLSNAVKFTPETGQVTLKLEYFDCWAQIMVQDTGIGISPDFLPYVFKRFSQESSSTTRKFGGLGLGLAIVKYLTEAHGGYVQAESPGENLGATFAVCLPLITTESEQTSKSQSTEAQVNFSGLRVLVVDDQASIGELVAYILEDLGAVVTVATSAVEALAALQQQLPDLLLCDIVMPDMDGYMLIQRVRVLSLEQGKQIPAIALTAHAGEYNQQQALAAGFQMHISKPVELEQLIRAIVSLVGQQ
jgi:signal transduction histidine kinase/CheY-like chemotaxis protein